MHALLFPEGRGQHRAKPLPFVLDGPQSIHQPPKDSLLGIVAAVADANSSGVTPDLGREKGKAQAGCRQRGVLQSEFGHMGDDRAVRCAKRRVPACILVYRYVPRRSLN